MTEEELRSRIHHAVDSRLAELQPAPGMPERAVNGRGEGVFIKKRMAFVPVLLLVVAMLSLSAAVAEELGFNLFPWLAENDPRMEVLAPEAVLDGVDVVTFDHDQMGRVEAAISNARFNGETLLLTYYIKNGVVSEPFTPTEVFLAKMEKAEPENARAWNSITWGSEAEFLWEKALEDGKPIGFRVWTVEVGDVLTNWDVMGKVMPGVGSLGRKDGVSFLVDSLECDHIRYDRDAPKEMNVHIDLVLKEDYLYFDGTSCYHLATGGREHVGTLRATVEKSDMEKSIYTGSGAFMGVDFLVMGKATEMSMQLHLVMKEGEHLPKLPFRCYYVMYLTDEDGRFINSRSYARGNASEEYVDFPSLGDMPEKLKLYIVPTCFSSLDDVFADPANTEGSTITKEDILDPDGLWVLNNGFDQLIPSAVLELEKTE